MSPLTFILAVELKHQINIFEFLPEKKLVFLQEKIKKTQKTGMQNDIATLY